MSHAKQHLAQARSKMDELHKSYAELQDKMQSIRTNADTVTQAVAKPPEDRVGFFKQLFRSNKQPTKAELDRARADLAEHAMATAQVAEIESAKTQALAELEDEHNHLVSQLRAIGKEFAEAHFEVAREEINEQIVPEFFKACETLNLAYGNLIGASLAHWELAKALRNEGFSVQPIGVEHPNRIIDVPLPGFTIGHVSMPNLVRINATELIDKAKAESLAKWR